MIKKLKLDLKVFELQLLHFSADQILTSLLWPAMNELVHQPF